MLILLKKIGKLLWLSTGGFILLWIGYFIYKLQVMSSPGLKWLSIFFLMLGLALAGIYIFITITGKIIRFGIKKKEK